MLAAVCACTLLPVHRVVPFAEGKVSAQLRNEIPSTSLENAFASLPDHEADDAHATDNDDGASSTGVDSGSAVSSKDDESMHALADHLANDGTGQQVYNVKQQRPKHGCLFHNPSETEMANVEVRLAEWSFRAGIDREARSRARRGDAVIGGSDGIGPSDGYYKFDIVFHIIHDGENGPWTVGH